MASFARSTIDRSRSSPVESSSSMICRNGSRPRASWPAARRSGGHSSTRAFIGPISRRSPGRKGVGRSSGKPSSRVPVRLPRSSTSQVPSSAGRMRQWRREICRSMSCTSHARDRPSTSGMSRERHEADSVLEPKDQLGILSEGWHRAHRRSLSVRPLEHRPTWDARFRGRCRRAGSSFSGDVPWRIARGRSRYAVLPLSMAVREPRSDHVAAS